MAGAIETMAVTPQMLVPAAISVPRRGGRPSLLLNHVTKTRPGGDRREHHRQARDAELDARRTGSGECRPARCRREEWWWSRTSVRARATPATAAGYAAAARGQWRPARRRRGCCRSGPARRESRGRSDRRARSRPSSRPAPPARLAPASRADQPEPADDERDRRRGVEQAAVAARMPARRAGATAGRSPPRTPSCRRRRQRRNPARYKTDAAVRGNASAGSTPNRCELPARP